MTADLDIFRAEARAWLEANCPSEMRMPMTAEFGAPWGGRKPTFDSDAQRIWFERMVERRWTAPTWPVEYGGAGLSVEEAHVLGDELRRIKARPPLIGTGLWMLGPALLRYGTEAQKRVHLPAIARGEIRWCQGYSEPGAGSDLASVRTRAEDRGDHFLVNGSKIWTSYANLSDWMCCLVRTDPNVRKQLGIGFLLIDMASPGVSTKPIVLIDGTADFCETFFDDVVVPKENLVGASGEGWSIAKYLMSHEREMIGGSEFEGELPEAGSLGRMLAAGHGQGDALLRADIVRYDVDFLAFQLTVQRFKDERAHGMPETPASASILKLAGANLEIRRKELTMSIGGTALLSWETGPAHAAVPPTKSWLRARASAIAGGTNEIQLNIIAKHALGL
jgi:alkylation response protein AidB-like acyl-CoA dehydrogenase